MRIIWGIKKTYLVIVIGILLALGTALTVNLAIFQREALERNLLYRAERVNSAIQPHVYRYLLRTDEKQILLQKNIQPFVHEAYISYAVVSAFKKPGSLADARVIYAYGQPVKDRDIELRSLTATREFRQRIALKNIYDVTYPVYSKLGGSDTPPLGLIRLGVRLDEVDRVIRRTIAKGMTLVLGVVLLSGFSLSIFMSGNLLRPLRKLTLATVAASHGDLRQEVDIAATNELGILARSFNLMIHDLREWRLKLEQANYLLEGKVKERTKDLKKLNEELMETNTRLRELNKVKTNFISMVSHELRTPLTAIKGFVSTLLRPDITLDEKTKHKYLTIVDTEADRLARLIENLLNITRIEAGKMELRYELVDARRLAQEVIEQAAIKAEGIRFPVAFEDQFPKIEADLDKLRQVFINLVSNAVKYSPPDGEIILAGRVLEDEVEFSVEDRGRGMSEPEVDRIFEKFYRVDDEVNQKNPGTGLGLAISRAIVELHGGVIWAESEPGKGTRFVFTVPVKAANSQADGEAAG